MVGEMYERLPVISARLFEDDDKAFKAWIVKVNQQYEEEMAKVEDVTKPGKVDAA